MMTQRLQPCFVLLITLAIGVLIQSGNHSSAQGYSQGHPQGVIVHGATQPMTYPSQSIPTNAISTNGIPITGYPTGSTVIYPPVNHLNANNLSGSNLTTTQTLPSNSSAIPVQPGYSPTRVATLPTPTLQQSPSRQGSRWNNDSPNRSSSTATPQRLPQGDRSGARSNDNAWANTVSSITGTNTSSSNGLANGSSPSRDTRGNSTRLASSRTSYASGAYQATATNSARLGSGRQQETMWRTDTADTVYRRENIQSTRLAAQQHRRMAETAVPVEADRMIENANLAQQWADLAERYLTLSDRVADARAKFSSTSRDYEDVHAKLEHYGLTSTVGMLLRNKKEQLNSWQVSDSQSLFIAQELAHSRQSQLELELNRYEVSDIAAERNRLVDAAGYDVGDTKHHLLVSRVGSLLTERSQWIGDLERGYEDYQNKLGELDSVTTASTTLATDYRTLINRHITWIRSDDAIGVQDIRDLRGGTAALFDSGRSADFGPTLSSKLNANTAGGMLLVAGIVALLLVRWRAKAWLLGIGKRTRMRESSSGACKAVASILTIVVALAFPAVLYCIARWLGTGIVSESTLFASKAFYAASLVLLLVELGRQTLRSHGILDKHVDVQIPGNNRAVNFLTILGFGLAVAAYTITLMSQVDHGMWRASVARFGFIFAMLVVATLAHYALRPTGGLLEPLIKKFGGSVIYQVRWVLYLAGIAFPLAMIGLSIAGYGFTANELTRRAIITLIAVLMAATLWSGLKILAAGAWNRLTGVVTPKVERDEYGVIETSGGHVSGTLAEHSLELKHHLAFLCQCGLVLGAVVCLGWLWVDVFPNVQMGNPVVWTVEDSVTRASVDANGQSFTETVQETKSVTALHVLLSAATFWVAFQLAKLLPALFDALVLQRVSFDEGMEHFSLVLGRGLLFGIGCLIACKLLGVRWQVIQWLAVGLTIGLGFGLQDMVRNLFGGLIVLFEKPARLGDLISVGNVTGRVSAQKLRTTVLSDDEGREVIVPNKNFVSEDVTNWMGAGRLQVIPIEVAVTRDERPADLCRSLQELAIEQEHVLISPAPQATLVCVGKRSQRIEVRAWVEEDRDADRLREHLLQVTTTFLKDKNWWVKNQPTQRRTPDPRGTRSSDLTGDLTGDMSDEAFDALSDDVFGESRPRRRRKRSA
ncbi:mechanosensitive ion channel domain-containing protein [Stieleria marina]|uniref:Putative MscS family protein.1 n=1 Tax=Stieleria marina TaxID=1930275 RepID=A0A517NW80_9BACT|nr:putative MscS family protein.1 precursor [Planctomycetes bacterium K23_9]